MERVTRPESGAELARFFQRIFAALIDLFLLMMIFIFGVVGYLGWFAPEALLAQTAITLAYFSIFNSGLVGGGTIGKHLMGVRVVNRAGDTIGFGRSVWRSAFDMIPSAAAAYLPLAMPNSDIPIAAIGAAVGGGFALTNLYLYCFNWETRQILHDLAAGTFVVQAETCDRPFPERTRWGHVAFAIVLIAASAYVGTKVRDFQEAVQGRPLCVEPIKAAVQTLPFVDRVLVDRNPWSPEAQTDVEHRTLWVFVRDDRPAIEAREVARKTLGACPAMRDDQRLTVMVIPPHRGYSMIPILRNFPATVKEWRDSFAFEASAKRQEGSCGIVSAVGSIPYASRVAVRDFYTALEDKSVHVKRIDISVSSSQVKLNDAAREAVRKALAACPAMDDATILNVVVTPAAGPRPEEYPGTAQEWRTSLASEAAHKNDAPRPASIQRRWRRPGGNFVLPQPDGQGR